MLHHKACTCLQEQVLDYVLLAEPDYSGLRQFPDPAGHQSIVHPVWDPFFQQLCGLWVLGVWEGICPSLMLKDTNESMAFVRVWHKNQPITNKLEGCVMTIAGERGKDNCWLLQVST